MSLAPGSRLDGPGRSSYLVGEPAGLGTRRDYFHARKVFWNVRGAPPSLREAEPDEFLNVLVRAPSPDVGDRTLPFELETVLSLLESPWLPAAVDLIDSPDGPLLVLGDPGGGPMTEAPLDLRRRFALESRDLIEGLHGQGLVAGGFDAADVLVDADGRWTYLGTDRVRRLSSRDEIQQDMGAWHEAARPLWGGPDDDWVRATVRYGEHGESIPRHEAGGEWRRGPLRRNRLAQLVRDMIKGVKPSGGRP